jgi:hypothetical protein
MNALGAHAYMLWDHDSSATHKQANWQAGVDVAYMRELPTHLHVAESVVCCVCGKCCVLRMREVLCVVCTQAITSAGQLLGRSVAHYLDCIVRLLELPRLEDLNLLLHLFRLCVPVWFRHRCTLHARSNQEATAQRA